MIKTLKISFSLKNAYRVNGILYSLKQIPLVGKLLPEALYGVRGLKVFANILSVLWEIVSIFLGKFLYLLLMVAWAGTLYGNQPKERLFMHIFLFLTVIGSLGNTGLFNPTKDKYYAIILMRMDAKEHALVDFTYMIMKVVVGFLPFTVFFGRSAGLPLWTCLELPFCVAGCKLAAVSFSLWHYERRDEAYNENDPSKVLLLSVALMLGAAYGLPAIGILLPTAVSIAVLLAFFPIGILGIHKILSFDRYREIMQEILGQMMSQTDRTSQVIKTANQKNISADTSIASSKGGFEYLNELFVKRHRKILWSSTKRISYVCACLVCGAVLILFLKPQLKPMANNLVMTCLPYFAFILFSINRGTNFTQALFMNCDHSLLTYSVYKQPKSVLKLFRIRLREIMKINAVPALILGLGLALILYLSGGTAQPLDYVVLIVSLLCMSLFFSVHYLTIYYLLQPYNAGTEMKSGMYRIVTILTYFACVYLMKLKSPTFLFGAMTIVFCVSYSIIACVLVYRLAPKTFRLRA